MVAWLTQHDVDTFGGELVDFAQRAAAHALAPTVQNLEAQNEELRQRLAKEARHNLDRAVERALPNYKEVDQDPRWHRWLLGTDPLTGVQRQQLLNDAIASGSAERCIAFFKGFQNAMLQNPKSYSEPRQTRSASRDKPFYTRANIKLNYEMYRKGAWTGREQEWARLERDMIAAGAEGRVLDPDFVTK